MLRKKIVKLLFQVVKSFKKSRYKQKKQQLSHGKIHGRKDKAEINIRKELYYILLK